MHIAPLMQLRLSLQITQSGCIVLSLKRPPAVKIIEHVLIILWLGGTASVLDIVYSQYTNDFPAVLGTQLLLQFPKLLLDS